MHLYRDKNCAIEFYESSGDSVLYKKIRNISKRWKCGNLHSRAQFGEKEST
jgi:hypothetical protein